MMNILDLFSGIGGFSLGLERAGMETVAFCEYDEPCRKVLRKHWPDVPIYPDIRELTGEQLEADGLTDIELICGGYPCQPFSVAGKRKGQEDDRHLWPEYFRLIQEIRPDWIIAENVAGHINMGLDEVLADLESEGYTWQPFVIPACAVNAPHRRDRIWIVAHADSAGSGNRRQINAESRRRNYTDDVRQVCGVSDVAISEGERCRKEREDSERCQERPASGGAISNPTSNPSRHGYNDDEPIFWNSKESRQAGSAIQSGQWWAVEPELGRVATGIPHRVDRLRQLGNSVVPQIPEIIGRAIMAIENEA